MTIEFRYREKDVPPLLGRNLFGIVSCSTKIEKNILM